MRGGSGCTGGSAWLSGCDPGPARAPEPARARSCLFPRVRWSPGPLHACLSCLALCPPISASLLPVPPLCLHLSLLLSRTLVQRAWVGAVGPLVSPEECVCPGSGPMGMTTQVPRLCPCSALTVGPGAREAGGTGVCGEGPGRGQCQTAPLQLLPGPGCVMGTGHMGATGQSPVPVRHPLTRPTLDDIRTAHADCGGALLTLADPG